MRTERLSPRAIHIYKIAKDLVFRKDKILHIVASRRCKVNKQTSLLM